MSNLYSGDRKAQVISAAAGRGLTQVNQELRNKWRKTSCSELLSFWTLSIIQNPEFRILDDRQSPETQ
jgi:hypothetical protein